MRKLKDGDKHCVLSYMANALLKTGNKLRL